MKSIEKSKPFVIEYTFSAADFWRVFLYIAVFSMLIPKRVIHGVWIGVDDLLSLVVWIFISYLVIFFKIRRETKIFWSILFLFIFFAISYTILGIVNSYAYLGHVSFPSELWQYLKRAAFFTIGFFAISTGGVTILGGYRTLLAGAFIASVIGIVQYAGGPIAELLANLYGRTDRQIEKSVYRSISSIRVFGVSGFSTSWGGLSAFFLTVALPGALMAKEYARSNTAVLAGLLAFCSAGNVLFSGSRGGIIAAFLGSGYILIRLLWNKLFRSDAKSALSY